MCVRGLGAVSCLVQYPFGPKITAIIPISSLLIHPPPALSIPHPHPPKKTQPDEELRRFAIDRLAYKVLATALQLAAEYVESDEVR